MGSWVSARSKSWDAGSIDNGLNEAQKTVREAGGLLIGMHRVNPDNSLFNKGLDSLAKPLELSGVKPSQAQTSNDLGGSHPDTTVPEREEPGVSGPGM